MPPEQPAFPENGLHPELLPLLLFITQPIVRKRGIHAPQSKIILTFDCKFCATQGWRLFPLPLI